MGVLEAEPVRDYLAAVETRLRDAGFDPDTCYAVREGLGAEIEGLAREAGATDDAALRKVLARLDPPERYGQMPPAGSAGSAAPDGARRGIGSVAILAVIAVAAVVLGLGLVFGG